MNGLWPFIWARLREPSTYAGVGAGLGSASAAAIAVGWLTVGGALASSGIVVGLIAAFVKETGTVIQADTATVVAPGASISVPDAAASTTTTPSGIIRP